MLNLAQGEFLSYLQSWQLAYHGDYRTAIPRLTALGDNAHDTSVRFRSNVTLVNMLEIAHRYEDAYTRMQLVLDMLPRIVDHRARSQALGVASDLYVAAGQSDLALDFANRLIAEADDPHSVCKGMSHRLDAYFKGGKQAQFISSFDGAVAACEAAKEPIYANSSRIERARIHLAAGQPRDAVELLLAHRDQALATGYGELTTEYDAVLARGYADEGNLADARRYAMDAVQEGFADQITKGLNDAWQVLYQVAKQQGDVNAALTYYEKFAVADKGYLNDVSARALAFQMVNQQVREKKAQIAALDQQNAVLKLKQQVGRQHMLVMWLGIALLGVLAGSIALYAIRTKRSQLKFQKLARRDGLTEIHNRPYFIECAEAELAYCRRSMRDASVIAIDLDHFKAINDEHGHAAGDDALKRAVAACGRHLRSVDIFGRLGGEEFGILLPDCVPERAADVAEKMRGEVEAIHGSQGGLGFPVTASFGVTAARWSGYELVQMLAHADSALYRAKREGRNRVAMQAESAARADSVPDGMADRRKAVS
ncbi:MAG: diguanylate cyclase [Proteobacteria bacterium]|nr:diguanylate cyclase [Pseudomonadota bacterium]